jgi:outer membrane protein assembly factor BamA
MLRAALCAVCLLGATALQAADSVPATEKPKAVSFRDPADGWFDVSEFLDTVYGFIPVVMPITEPAGGYGAAGALVFIDRNVPGLRPSILAVGGLGTENGTRGAFGAHLGTWLDGKLRTTVALADMDVNLDFFGLGGDRAPVGSLGYTLSPRGGMAGGSYRIGESPVWLGLRYTGVKTQVTLNAPNPGLPGIAAGDFDLYLTALTPSITLDLRDNFFTPIHGWYLDLSVPIFREAFGGDRDFETATLTGIHYRPLSQSLYFSARGTAKSSSDGTPFFLRPYVSLRGVQALRYQGEQAAEFEAEVRWQFHPRFSAVGFAGTGMVRGNAVDQDSDKSVVAGGFGFRYMIARKHGLHMGLDLGFGPDNPVVYVVFGNAWLRP